MCCMMLWYQEGLPDPEEWQLLDIQTTRPSKKNMEKGVMVGIDAQVDVVYKAIRYHLLMERNNKVAACEENDALRYPPAADDESAANQSQERRLAAYGAVMFDICANMLQLYGRHLSLWVVPGADDASASVTEVAAARRAGYYNGFPCRRQLRTMRGVLSPVDPAKYYMRVYGCPTANTFPHLPVVTKDRLVVHHREPLYDGIFLVEAAPGETTGATTAGTLMAMKTVYNCYRTDTQDFIREADTLGKIPSHPNVVRFHGLVVDGDGLVDGILTSYLDGKPLTAVKQATMSERERWRSQINAALDHLHSSGGPDNPRAPVIWGDAKTDNVMITSAGDAVIFDFGGGWTYAGVAKEDENTLEVDELGRAMIMQFLAELPLSGEGAAAAAK